jgi:hypothetical protein
MAFIDACVIFVAALPVTRFINVFGVPSLHVS